MREQFEKLPEIAEKLRYGIYYSDENGKYYRSYGSSSDALLYVRAAWYAFQEQQNKIEKIVILIDSLISNSEQFGFESEQTEAVLMDLWKALRGEHD